MTVEDGPPAFHVGIRHINFAIEAARAQQSGVEIFRSVGRRDNDNALAALETVHGREQGVNGLLMLAVRVELAVFAHTIDFVDEDNGWFIAAGILEQLADTFGSDADK